MTVFCRECRRVLAERVEFLDAREFQRLHKAQTGHNAVIERTS